MKLHKKSEFHKELFFSLSYTDLFFPLFLLISLHIKNLIDIQKIETNSSLIQKQLSRGVLTKRCSENMQQIYRGTPMPKCNFNKVPKQLY